MYIFSTSAEMKVLLITDHQDVTEILLKVAISTRTITLNLRGVYSLPLQKFVNETNVFAQLSETKLISC
jgi:hypothetical protein